jgi:hypothetical protein
LTCGELAAGAGVPLITFFATTADSTFAASRVYIFVIVKVPEPVQPTPPVRDHVPVIVFPFTVPVSVNVLPLGDPDITLKPNWPVTWPLKSPLKANDPLSVSPDTKHGPAVEKLNWLTLRVPSLFTITDVAKLKFVSVRTAVQVPLMFPCWWSFEPHPTSVKTIATNHATASFFIDEGPL